MSNQMEDWMNDIVAVDSVLSQKPKIDYHAAIWSGLPRRALGVVSSAHEGYLGVQESLMRMEELIPSVSGNGSRPSLEDQRALYELQKRHSVSGIPEVYENGEKVWQAADGLSLGKRIVDLNLCSTETLEGELEQRKSMIKIDNLPTYSIDMNSYLPIDYKILSKPSYGPSDELYHIKNLSHVFPLKNPRPKYNPY